MATAPAAGDDLAAAEFVRAGLEARPCMALDHPTSPILAGWRIEQLGAELVFRTLPPSSVLLVRYRRMASQGGLRNQFAAILWFVELLIDRQPTLGIERVVGTVDTRHFRADGGLDDQRLFRFYAHCGTRLIDADEMPGLSPIERRWHRLAGSRWACIDFVDYHRPGRRPSPGLAPVRRAS
jgi:type III secretion system regulator LcrR